jgi:hypothetical protein
MLARREGSVQDLIEQLRCSSIILTTATHRGSAFVSVGLGVTTFRMPPTPHFFSASEQLLHFQEFAERDAPQTTENTKVHL